MNEILVETVEERLSVREAELAILPNGMRRKSSAKPWWKEMVGVYRDDASFDDAMRLGREWRESFRPKDDEVAPL